MKKIVTLIALIITFSGVSAQTYSGYNRGKQQQTIKQEPIFGFDKKKLTFGGDLGLQFGDYTVVNVAPQVGYNFSNIFNAGAGIGYSFYKEDYHTYGYSSKWEEKRHYASFNLYAKVYPIPYIVLMVQPEAARMWRTIEQKNSGEKYTENKFVPSVIVGGGLRLGPATFMIQYDVVQNDDSPYGDNIFYSVGYTFGW